MKKKNLREYYMNHASDTTEIKKKTFLAEKSK